jgi:hypothetical protein
VKKKVKKTASKVEQARQRLRRLTNRKKHYSADTEFGVLTMEDARPGQLPKTDQSSSGGG